MLESLREAFEGTERADLLLLGVRHWGRERDAELREATLTRLRQANRTALEGVLSGLMLGGTDRAEESEEERAARSAAVELAGVLPAAALGERVVRLLGDGGLGDAAERAIEAMTTWLIRGREEGRAVGAGQVGEAVLMGIDRYREHRRAVVLRSLCRLTDAKFGLMARRDEAAGPARWLSDAEHAAGPALRRVLRTEATPSVLGAAWVWLKVPSLAGACADALVNPAADGLGAIVRRPHLAVNPMRHAALRKHAGARGPVDALLAVEPVIKGLSSTERAGVPGWLARAPAPLRARDRALGALLSDSDAGVRHATLRATAAMDGAAATPCGLDMCFDGDARVARSAALHLASGAARDARTESARARVLASLTRSPHGAVRVVARGWAATELGSVPGDVDHPEFRGRMARARREDGAALMDRIGKAIAGGTERAGGAVLAARRLGLVAELAPALLRVIDGYLSGGGDERAACAAAGALGEMSDAKSADALGRCLRAPAARLRASAADAFHRRWRRQGVLAPGVDAALREMCQDAEHRPRASAARVLLGTTPAAAPRMTTTRDLGERTLVAMLEDGRGMHRAAGLWLAERAASRVAPLPEVVDAVASLARAARGDERARARRAAERLVIEVRSGWAGRAAAVGGADDAQEAVA